jgi:ferritin-like metal-binding protein YciE
MAFSPWNTGGGLELHGALNLVRDYAYPLAQKGRHITTGEPPMTDRSPQDQLVKYLTDCHSIELQALVQMRRAPDLAHDDDLARIFSEHEVETAEHERRVRERLESHGAQPSKLKDAAGKAGAVGMLLFAGANPDTPGKLTAHAFSYEHMELAAYELLRTAAIAAGDEETEQMAVEIAAQEEAMAQRLADRFDVAVEASLRDLSPDDIGAQLDAYLRDAHALEQQAVQLMSSAPGLVDDEGLAQLYRDHEQESREHLRLVEERLEARGSSRSAIKDLALRGGGLGIGAFFGAQPDTTPKLAGFSYAFENLEIGGYELLARIATRAGDAETRAVAERILVQERTAAERISGTLDRTMGREMAKHTS